MIILNIILSILSAGAFMLLAILYGRVVKLQIELKKTKEGYNTRFEDIDKKIRIISNKKW